MSVLVKDMDLPENCFSCPLKEEGFCNITNAYAAQIYKRNSDCPLVELPEHHGRLIDAEFLKEHLYTCATNGRPLHRMYQELDELLEAINDIPTIIEAEGADE